MISNSQPGDGSRIPPGWTPVTPDRRRRPRLPGSGWPIALALIAAVWLSGFAVNNLRGTRYSSAINSIFPRLGSNHIDDGSVQAAWDIVSSEYYVRGADSAKGTAGAESGIVDYLHNNFKDRFSAYFSADQYRMLQDNLNGRRKGGVGIELEARCAGGAICINSQPATVVAITGVLHNQPAERGGVRRGDLITAVNGKPLSGLAPDPETQIQRSQPLIDNPAGTAVTLTVLRGAQSVDLHMTDENLSLPSVFTMRFGSVVLVQVTGFDTGTGDAVHTQLGDALKSGAGSIILDLRHNPGGFVTESQKVASQFLTHGGNQQDVVVRRGRLDSNQVPDTAQKVERDAILDPKDGGATASSQKLVVLIDGDSASAAEIVTAALHDYKRATVIGVKSFGKGSVQEDFNLPDGADLHLTVEKWFGPSGESIDGTGITPDTAVTLADEDHRFRLESQSAEPAQDAQFQAALAVAQSPG